MVTGREIGLEVNADKTMYIVMYRGQNAGRSHSKCLITVPLIDGKSSNIWEKTTHQNSNQKESKSRLNSGNACHSVQNLLSSRLLSKNLKSKLYRTIILPVFF